MRLRVRLAAILFAVLASPSVRADDIFAVIGDAGDTNENSRSVLESIRRSKVRRLVLPGDNLYSSTYAKVWKPWKEMGATFDVVAIGNHNGGYEEEIRFFGMPAEHYSVTVGRARFIVLNSDNESSAAAQAKWLGGQLSEVKDEQLFIVYHHPAYTISKDHQWKEKVRFQKAIRPVIWKHRPKITALIFGHDHLASLLRFNDLPVILSGAVQNVRKDSGVDTSEDGVRVKTEWFFDGVPYWARLAFPSAKGAKVRVDFIRASDDRVSCTALLSRGRAAEPQPNCSGK